MRARSVTGEAIALLGSVESAGGDEGSEALVEGGGADAAARAQLGKRHRLVDIGERAVMRSSTELGAGVCGMRRSTTSSAMALAR